MCHALSAPRKLHAFDILYRLSANLRYPQSNTPRNTGSIEIIYRGVSHHTRRITYRQTSAPRSISPFSKTRKMSVRSSAIGTVTHSRTHGLCRGVASIPRLLSTPDHLGTQPRQKPQVSSYRMCPIVSLKVPILSIRRVLDCRSAQQPVVICRSSSHAASVRYHPRSGFFPFASRASLSTARALGSFAMSLMSWLRVHPRRIAARFMSSEAFQITSRASASIAG